MPNIKKLAFMCARCFTTQVDKLAWFVGKTLFNESLLCRTCWQSQFKLLTEKEKQEYSFYAKNK